MKKSILFISILFVLIFIYTGCSVTTPYDEMEYRVDVEPIIYRFSFPTEIEHVYWKGTIIGKSEFGPTTYSITGFIIPSDVDKLYIINNLNIGPNTDLVTPEGINSDVTGYSDFEWHECSDLSKIMLKTKFIGTVLYDIHNGLIYFDVVNA